MVPDKLQSKEKAESGIKPWIRQPKTAMPQKSTPFWTCSFIQWRPIHFYWKSVLTAFWRRNKKPTFGAVQASSVVRTRDFGKPNDSQNAVSINEYEKISYHASFSTSKSWNPSRGRSVHIFVFLSSISPRIFILLVFQTLDCCKFRSAHKIGDPPQGTNPPFLCSVHTFQKIRSTNKELQPRWVAHLSARCAFWRLP